MIFPVSITAYKYSNIISTLNVNKAVGPDLISHKALKNIKSSVARPLCKLFNKSLHGQMLPIKWKESIVNPLFKKGDKSLASNYRPISLFKLHRQTNGKVRLQVCLQLLAL